MSCLHSATIIIIVERDYYILGMHVNQEVLNEIPVRILLVSCTPSDIYCVLSAQASCFVVVVFLSLLSRWPASIPELMHSSAPLSVSANPVNLALHVAFQHAGFDA